MRMTSPTFRGATAPADEQGGDLGAVEDGAAADGKANARAEKEPAEYRRQQQVVRDVGVRNDCERDRQTRNTDRAANRERPADLPVPDRDERQVHDRKDDGERSARDFPEQHRHAGHATVDEIAREQEPLQTETG